MDFYFSLKTTQSSFSDVSVIPLGESDSRNGVHLEFDEPLDVLGLVLQAQEVAGLAQNRNLGPMS